MGDADITTHLLFMCPIKWQTYYNLTENSTPVSTRALLPLLENIKNNAELDYKSQNPNKSTGAKGKCNMESISSKIPKKSKKVGGTDKYCVLCKKHGGYSKATTHVTVIVLMRMAL